MQVDEKMVIIRGYYINSGGYEENIYYYSAVDTMYIVLNL